MTSSWDPSRRKHTTGYFALAAIEPARSQCYTIKSRKKKYESIVGLDGKREPFCQDNRTRIIFYVVSRKSIIITRGRGYRNEIKIEEN